MELAVSHTPCEGTLLQAPKALQGVTQPDPRVNQPRSDAHLAHPHSAGCRTGPRTLYNTVASRPCSPETAAGPGPGLQALPASPVASGSCSGGPRPRRSCPGHFTGLSPRCCRFASARTSPPFPGHPIPGWRSARLRRCRRHRVGLKLAPGSLLPAWCLPVNPSAAFGVQHPPFGASSHLCPRLASKIIPTKFGSGGVLCAPAGVACGTGVPVGGCFGDAAGTGVGAPAMSQPSVPWGRILPSSRRISSNCKGGTGQLGSPGGHTAHQHRPRAGLRVTDHNSQTCQTCPPPSAHPKALSNLSLIRGFSPPLQSRAG